MKRYGFVLGLFLFCGVAGYSRDTAQIKALWVVRDALKNRATIEQMVSDVAATGVTDIFLQVRGRGDAYYQSDLVPRAAGMPADFDPLDYALKLLRRYPVRVHLWLNVFLIWSADELPASPQHIYRLYPEWSVVDKENQSMAELGTRKVKAMQSEGIFFSPSVNAYREHFFQVVAELVQRYSADGIHLDYIRFPSENYDYSVSTRSQFMLKYHLDPLTLKPNHSTHFTPDQNRWVMETWNRFRREMITGFVRALRDSLRRWDSTQIFTAAVFADVSVARNEKLQDWPEWVRQGLMDYVVVMNYASDDHTFRRRIQAMRAELGDMLIREKVVQGIALYNQSPASVKNKIRICEELRLPGRCFFSYQAMLEKNTYREIVIQNR